MKFNELYNRILGGTKIYVADETKDECEELYVGPKRDVPTGILAEIGDEEVLDIGTDRFLETLDIWIVRDKKETK